MRHHRKKARTQFWSVKAIAKRNRLKAESRLPETHPVPNTPRLTAGLKPGEVALIGWQYAAPKLPLKVARAIERAQKKDRRRQRYERRQSPLKAGFEGFG